MLGSKHIVRIRDARIMNGNHSVLEGLNFELYEAEFCYVIGSSGSGKTTFLKALYGDLAILEGQASILDRDMTRIERNEIPELRREIGMIFQDFKLFQNWSVRENLSFILKATDWKSDQEIETRIGEVLQQVSLENKIEEKVFQLSGGEQQRLAIARSILNKPQLLIADEPTGNLDPESADNIMQLLRTLASSIKMAVIFATHDQRIIEKFPARKFLCREKGLIEV